MNGERFLAALNEVGDKYYAEAENYRSKGGRWRGTAALAACAALALAISLAALRQLPGQEQIWPDGDGPVAAEPDSGGDGLLPDIPLAVNEIAQPQVVTGGIDLSGEDYAAMTAEELLAYYGVELPVTEYFPSFALEPGEYGVYGTEERGIYYDGNYLVFADEEGNQSLWIGLGKVTKRPYDLFTLTDDELQFTEVNGRELAVFHYTDEVGQSCYYTEFLQGDVAFLVGGENLSPELYGRLLQLLVEEKQEEGTIHTVSGRISVVDPYANHIGITLDEDAAPQYSRGYGIDLPEGMNAEEYALRDRVEVTYRGEPATICTIWAEQLVGITKLS